MTSTGSDAAQSEARSRRTPQQRRSSEKVERILAAAESLLNERHPDEVTVKLITERAEVAAPTFYGYFRDRDDVVTTLETRFIEQAGAVMDGIAARGPYLDWRDAMRTIYDTFVVWFRDHPAFRVLFYSTPLAEDIYTEDRRGNEEIADVFRRLIESHTGPTDVPGHVFQFAVDLTERVLAHGFAEQADGDPQRLGEGLVAVTAYLATYLD